MSESDGAKTLLKDWQGTAREVHYGKQMGGDTLVLTYLFFGGMPLGLMTIALGPESLLGRVEALNRFVAFLLAVALLYLIGWLTLIWVRYRLYG
jgi:hypothetical protein